MKNAPVCVQQKGAAAGDRTIADGLTVSAVAIIDKSAENVRLLLGLASLHVLCTRNLLRLDLGDDSKVVFDWTTRTLAAEDRCATFTEHRS